MMPSRISALAWTLAAGGLVSAQPLSPWPAHDTDRPRPSVVAAPPGQPPADAIVLFDGSSLNAWQAADGSPTKWELADGCLVATPHSGPLQTKAAFGDVQLHLEWSAPTPVAGRGQGRGNSGVYLMQKYEVQILDSFENETYADGQAAALYGQSPPLVNVCRPPGEWQTYDIVFRRPRFDQRGRLTKPAVMTVFHNGVLVQDHFELWGPTNWLEYDAYAPHPDRLPIRLQDHGNPVRFRSIWLRELAEPAKFVGLPQAAAKIELPTDYLQSLTGPYEGFRVSLDRDQLLLHFFGRAFQLVPESETRFVFRNTGAAVTFHVTDGRATSMEVDLMGDKQTAKRIDSKPSP